jgi:hypothetical protein
MTIMKKFLLIGSLMLGLAAIGVVAQVYLAPPSLAGDPRTTPP